MADQQPTILFKGRFSKLNLKDTGKPTRTATLLLVVPASPDEIANRAFLKYECEGELLQFPNAEYYLLLLFQKPDGDIFTTVRARYNETKPSRYSDKVKLSASNKSKEAYYKELIGQQFNIIINA